MAVTIAGLRRDVNPSPVIAVVATEGSTMTYFWILIAMPAFGLVYFAYVTIRGGGVKLPNCVTPLSDANPGAIKMVDDRAPRRKVKWISGGECRRLLHESSDVVFVDLRSESNTSVPFAVPEALVLSSSQIFDMLRWLPASTGVVLYGTSTLCSSVVRSARNIYGWAPIYVLDQRPVLAGEVTKCSTQPIRVSRT